MSNTKQLKVVVLGERASGKTSFIKRFTEGDFTDYHVATFGCRIYRLGFKTNKNTVCFNLWDTGSGIEDSGYWKNSDAFLVFLDGTKDSDIPKTLEKIGQIKNFCDEQKKDIPIIVCANKVDDDVADVANVTYHFQDYKTIAMSVKTLRNYDLPFLEILKKIYGSDTIIDESSYT